VAVYLVVAFHSGLGRFAGGFIGVDIFFVLSGFLITSIIWREIALGEFTIRRFYDRRLRRIVPALLLVLVATTLAAVLWLLPMDLVGYGKSLLATVGFVANVYFWRDTDYFARSAEEKPLLHIWSLGVEEQFYLLFPLLLVLIASRARDRPVPWIAALVLASVLLDMFMRRIGGALPAFYLLPTRAWELGAGALLPFIPSGSDNRPGLRAWLAAVGAGLVALGLACGPAAVPSALPDALPAVIGTCLMVWSGAGVRNPVARALASSPLVFVGLISYSLYLWHWPVIVLLQYFLVRDLGPLEASLAVALMLGAAIASWRYVERPFRSSALPIVTVRYLALVGGLLGAAVGAALIESQGLPARLGQEAARINAAAGTNYRCAVFDYLHLAQSRACVLELPSRDPKDADVVLLEVQHQAHQALPALADELDELAGHRLGEPVDARDAVADREHRARLGDQGRLVDVLDLLLDDLGNLFGSQLHGGVLRSALR
jgi:peptidoglycan/LPS O-acetylase OafA/YrhL